MQTQTQLDQARAVMIELERKLSRAESHLREKRESVLVADSIVRDLSRQLNAQRRQVSAMLHEDF